MHIISNNTFNNNYRQNFTAVRFPEEKQIIDKMGEEIGNRLLEKKPEIEDVSNDMNTDFEITFDSFGYLNIYAGKMSKRPYQTKHEDLPKYIKPNRGTWIRTDYNLDRNARIIPDTIVSRCISLACDYSYKKASGSVEGIRIENDF